MKTATDETELSYEKIKFLSEELNKNYIPTDQVDIYENNSLVEQGWNTDLLEKRSIQSSSSSLSLIRIERFLNSR